MNRLGQITGYGFEAMFIAPATTPGPAALVGALRAQLRSRRYELVHAHGEVAAVLCLPALALRPSVVTIHGLHLVRRLHGWRRTAAETSLRIVARASSKTICVGEAEFSEVESVLGSEKKIALIRNGVDLVSPPTSAERSAARAGLDLPPGKAVGLFLAALDPHKDPLVVARAALEAAREGVPLVLLFAGDGPLAGDLETLAGEAGVLRLAGFQSNVRRALAAADFFVLPSRREGLSFSLLEAMAVGLPPVVSDAPGNPEAVGDAGIIVSRGDVAAFRKAFELLALDPEERERMGTRARQRAAELFDARRMLEETRQIYDEVLASVG